jgi:tetratricopeptide (TPR) repeat protein
VAILTQPPTIRRLAGVGKTQTAAEYAHRYSKEYRAVLWVDATSRQTLFSAIASLASTLNLTEKEFSDKQRAFNAVKNWLDAHSDWLLIFDNVEDVVWVSDFFANPGHGHVLITTDVRVTKVIEGIEVPALSPGESVTFLLNRAGLPPPDSPSDAASSRRGTGVWEVSELLAGFPFALELAGAYMREMQCSFSDYIEYYQDHQAKRLQAQRASATDCPEAAAVTCALAFQEVQNADAAAADLLRLVAYFSPSDIPEDLILAGLTDLDSAPQTNAVSKQRLESAFRLLQRYSLIHYDDATRTLAVHPLVQSILKQEVKRKVQRQWAERATRLVSRTFPSVEPGTWSRCEQYLPHALVCVAHIKHWEMTFPEAVQLLNQAGYYLEVRGQCIEAQTLYQKAWIIHEKTLGPLHPLTAASLTTLAKFYEGWGMYWHAESFYRKARTIYEKILGPTHPITLESINNLARLYRTIDHLPR